MCNKNQSCDELGLILHDSLIQNWHTLKFLECYLCEYCKLLIDETSTELANPNPN